MSMNVLMLLIPKARVDFLFSDFTVRQALEKMEVHGYNMIPVIDRKTGVYQRSVQYGDILHYLLLHRLDFEDLERIPLSEIVSARTIRPVYSTADTKNMVDIIMDQNYVPVIDDKGVFIGIVTRKAIMSQFMVIK